jgi:hypothetical protein
MCPLRDGFPGQPGPPPWVTYRATGHSVSPASTTDEGWLCSPAMTDLIDMSASTALDRVAAWQVALRAENKSPGTVTTYADCVTRYLRWCAAGGHRLMRRACLNQWVAGMLDAGSAPGTARIRQQAVRRFATWLTEGGELATHPFPGMKAPHVEPPLVEPLTDTELRALIATCAVPDNDPSTGDRLHHRGDEAIIRLMLETAIRSGELVDLSSTTSISSRGSSPSGAARAAAGGSSRSDPPPPRHCSPTSPNAKAIRSPTLPTSGSGTAPSDSAETGSTDAYDAAPREPASRGSDPTGCGTPPRTGGSPPEAPNPA